MGRPEDSELWIGCVGAAWFRMGDNFRAKGWEHVQGLDATQDWTQGKGSTEQKARHTCKGWTGLRSEHSPRAAHNPELDKGQVPDRAKG